MYPWPKASREKLSTESLINNERKPTSQLRNINNQYIILNNNINNNNNINEETKKTYPATAAISQLAGWLGGSAGVAAAVSGERQQSEKRLGGSLKSAAIEKAEENQPSKKINRKRRNEMAGWRQLAKPLAEKRNCAVSAGQKIPAKASYQRNDSDENYSNWYRNMKAKPYENSGEAASMT